jgi:SAM-dependent methyltransferase
MICSAELVARGSIETKCENPVTGRLLRLPKEAAPLVQGVAMFNKSAEFYDAIYQGKDYARECTMLVSFIDKYKRTEARSLLDIACGTGHHISFLKHQYRTEGMDIEESLLVLAKQRNPGVAFRTGDMTNFRLDEKFDVITCLFSAIAYAKDERLLQQTILCMAEHLNPGGVMLVEPWFAPDTYFPGTLHACFVDRRDLKIARMNISAVRDAVSVLEFHYMIGTTDGIETFVEKHELGLFTEQQYRDAFEGAGLNVAFDSVGLTDRGLYIGVKSPP